jgi:copper chaperone
MEQTTVYTSGMTCDGCAQSVKRVLSDLPGVETAEVSLARNQAIVSFDPHIINRARITQAIENAGFETR